VLQGVPHPPVVLVIQPGEVLLGITQSGSSVSPSSGSPLGGPRITHGFLSRGGAPSRCGRAPSSRWPPAERGALDGAATHPFRGGHRMAAGTGRRGDTPAADLSCYTLGPSIPPRAGSAGEGGGICAAQLRDLGGAGGLDPGRRHVLGTEGPPGMPDGLTVPPEGLPTRDPPLGRSRADLLPAVEPLADESSQSPGDGSTDRPFSTPAEHPLLREASSESTPNRMICSQP
jgi:hypothetical protein